MDALGKRADDNDTHETSIEQTQRQHEQEKQKRTQAQHTYKQANLALVGIPPWDLIDALADALRAAAFDVDEVFQRAVSCSNEFLYPVEQSSRGCGAPCTFGVRTGCC